MTTNTGPHLGLPKLTTGPLHLTSTRDEGLDELIHVIGEVRRRVSQKETVCVSCVSLNGTGSLYSKRGLCMDHVGRFKRVQQLKPNSASHSTSPTSMPTPYPMSEPWYYKQQSSGPSPEDSRPNVELHGGVRGQWPEEAPQCHTLCRS